RRHGDPVAGSLARRRLLRSAPGAAACCPCRPYAGPAGPGRHDEGMSCLPTTSPGEVRVRPRRAADLAPLGEALLAQQPGSRYPFRNPLPAPVAEFMHFPDAAAAWTAELDGRPVGHVCRTGPVHGFPDA